MGTIPSRCCSLSKNTVSNKVNKQPCKHVPTFRPVTGSWTLCLTPVHPFHRAMCS